MVEVSQKTGFEDPLTSPVTGGMPGAGLELEEDVGCTAKPCGASGPYCSLEAAIIYRLAGAFLILRATQDQPSTSELPPPPSPPPAWALSSVRAAAQSLTPTSFQYIYWSVHSMELAWAVLKLL